MSVVGVINTFRLDATQQKLTDVKIEYFLISAKYHDVQRELDDIKNPPVKVQCEASTVNGLSDTAEYLFNQL